MTAQQSMESSLVLLGLEPLDQFLVRQLPSRRSSTARRINFRIGLDTA
jgi:hypothetical protein